MISPHVYDTKTDLPGFAGFIERAKPLLPVALLPIVLLALWVMFHKTWRELDLAAQASRGKILSEGKYDKRPMVALSMCALILALQEYYGGRSFFDQQMRPLLEKFNTYLGVHGFGNVPPPGAEWHPGMIDPLRLEKYAELWGYGWWSATRITGYVLIPLPLWKLFFPKDSILDMGLRTRGFFKHAWIYGLLLAVVLPAMWIVAHQPDFGSYYPFYKLSSRSWMDFLMWEAMYFAQFFALEVFFRGFWLNTLRKSLGSGAIFVMAVPYCMIHFGKPYLEAVGAIVAGIALGSLSMKTKSIYQGFLVHITVAGLMDWLALAHRHQMPTVLWGASS